MARPGLPCATEGLRRIGHLAQAPAWQSRLQVESRLRPLTGSRSLASVLSSVP